MTLLIKSIGRQVILNQDPLPTLYKAFGTICREISRRGIMKSASSAGTSPLEIGAGLYQKVCRISPHFGENLSTKFT